jgi:sec-independent protein translocase protein TatA
MSPTHLIFLGILALLLFGAKRLPEMARSLGTGMREFKDSVSGNSRSELPSATSDPVPTPSRENDHVG